MLTLKEAAELVGVPEAQLLRWASGGVGPRFEGTHLSPERMRYEPSELERWRLEKKEKSSPDQST